MRISSSSVLRSSFEAFLNSARLLPRERPSSGSLRGPKMTSAIRGMLATLDPHSSYFTPQEYARMRERQEGRYYGIGVSIVSLDNDITAVTVFEGSPAYKKGIRSGDIITKVNGDSAKGWTT